MKRILLLTAVVCSIFLFYSSAPGTSSGLYANPASDSAGINFISIKKVKKIVINDIFASEFNKNFITKVGNEYLITTTWGPIVYNSAIFSFSWGEALSYMFKYSSRAS